MIPAMRFATLRAWQLSKLVLWAPFAVWLVFMAGRAYNIHTDPVQAWFQPIAIEVPDYCKGEDPVITYERAAIKKEFDGEFSAHFDNLGPKTFPTCGTTANFWHYTPRPHAKTSVRLSNFINRVCNLETGTWILTMNWLVKASGFPPTTISLSSNSFKVLPETECQDATASNQ